MPPRLLDLPSIRREHQRAMRAPRFNALADATWVRLAAERAAFSDRPLAVASRYDRAAIMHAAHAVARVRRLAGAREPWPVLISQGLRGAWIATRRALPASAVPNAAAIYNEIPADDAGPTEADLAAMWAELGDAPSPASDDVHSDAHDEAMCAWHDAECAAATSLAELPAHVPRAA